MTATKCPVFVITGFLGSGKTTLLNNLVNQADKKDTAVIINEFGEVGIDHLLVKKSFDDVVVLKNGCVCCTIRGDLLDTLETLAIRQERGEIPNFNRVVIETTGLADPAPILQTLMTDPVVNARYTLNSIVTTVDGVTGLNQLDNHPEPVRQAAIADLLLLTKGDLADQVVTTELLKRLETLNPAAEKHQILYGEIAPDLIFSRQDFNPHAKNIDVSSWLGKKFIDGHVHDTNQHDQDISTFVITKDTPLPWPVVKRWLEAILSLRGQDVLRFKGVADVVGTKQPIILQGVQHIVHEPELLDEWPDGQPTSTFVFIGRSLKKAEIEYALDQLLAAKAA